MLDAAINSKVFRLIHATLEAMKFPHIRVTDEVLLEINQRLDWHAPTALDDGRIVGRITPGKRGDINRIPDKRIDLLNSFWPLAGKTVLEVGCFEGIHTLGLLSHQADVTAIDVRPENIIKTLTRVSVHGASTRAFVTNCEEMDPSFGRYDLVFHFGVLYHLTAPVQHLKVLGSLTENLYLDTHVAPKDATLDRELVDGRSYDYMKVSENGWKDPFSGAYDHAKHLTYTSLQRALANAGFQHQKLLQLRHERHGPRVLMFASSHSITTTMPDVSNIRGI